MTSNESQGDSYVLPNPHAVAESAHKSRKILKQNERTKNEREKIMVNTSKIAIPTYFDCKTIEDVEAFP